MFAGKKSAQIREILISESAWEEMTCLFAPSLSGKGYFLGVLMTATFGNYAYLRAEKLGQLDNFFTHICQLVALITIGLLFIGVLNAPINAYEMVIYPIAFFVCLFGQMRLFRSV